MTIQVGKRYKFTADDIMELSGLKGTTVRCQLQRLCQRGKIKHVETLKPHGTKVYSSSVDPLMLIGQGSMPTETPAGPPPSTYLNNPFNLRNAIDMRWKNEDLVY